MLQSVHRPFQVGGPAKVELDDGMTVASVVQALTSSESTHLYELVTCACHESGTEQLLDNSFNIDEFNWH